MKHGNIELHIEELVLRGFSPTDRYRISQAMERALARLLIEQGTPPSLAQRREITHLDGGAFEVAPGSRVEAFGVQVALTVYRGLAG